VSATEEDTALPHLPLLQLHFARDTPALLAHVRAHKALAFADWRSVDVPASERAQRERESERERAKREKGLSVS
jgi:hypothetical protein